MNLSETERKIPGDTCDMEWAYKMGQRKALLPTLHFKYYETLLSFTHSVQFIAVSLS